MTSSLSRRMLLGSSAAALTCPMAVAESPRKPIPPNMHFDGADLIVQKDGDGGDTAQREGWAWFGIGIREKILHNPWEFVLPKSLEETRTKLEVGQTGQFVRNPSGRGDNSWWADPDRFSRDQQVPLIAAFSLWGDHATVMRMRNALRRCPFPPLFECVQGTKDVEGLDHRNLFRRALGETPDEAGDVQLAGGVASRLAGTSLKPNDVGDDLNLIVNLLMASLYSPSATSNAALDAYRKNRTVCSGGFLSHYRQAFPGDFCADEETMVKRIKNGVDSLGWTTDCPRILGVLRWYFRVESGGNPDLAELYAPIVDRFLTVIAHPSW